MVKGKRKMVNGQSLFEVVVAIAISALIIVTIVSLVSNSLRNATFSKNNSQAASYGQQATEWVRSERDNDIAAFVTHATTSIWCFKDLTWSITGACPSNQNIPDTPFYREGHFTSSLVSGKTVIEADIVVSWTDSQGLHQVTSATSFTDWRQR